MNAQKWFYCTMYIAALTGTGSVSWQMGRLEAQRQDSPSPCLARQTAAVTEKPSYFNVSDAKPAVSASDAEIKRYYFDHIWEFQPLPHSPRERAKVWREIEMAIREKLAVTAQPS